MGIEKNKLHLLEEMKMIMSSICGSRSNGQWLKAREKCGAQ